MRGANVSFYPVAVGAPLGAWGVAGGRELAGHDADFETAYRLTVSEAGATALVLGLKYLVRRPRPYETVSGITSRSARLQPGEAFDPYAFPSGHAALSFALATSLTLSHPRWYVAGPTYAWAASVATSRVWLGVHYPSDVLVGAVLGAAVGITVHRLREAITPGALTDDPTSPAGTRLFVLRWPLGG
ncbi:MAG: phosphatase PAP2 family protein [Bacteroidetes bacterium]|nr:phosphatase PAP2 family protein [Bacteroidota bacterium]